MARVLYESGGALLSGLSEPKAAAPAEDRSAEIATHLASAAAVADLVKMVCGCRVDESDSMLDELNPATLRSAMYSIRDHIEHAESLQIEQDRWTRESAIRCLSGGEVLDGQS